MQSMQRRRKTHGGAPSRRREHGSASLGSFIAGVAVGGATVLLVVYLAGSDSEPVEVVAEPALSEPSPEPEIDISFFRVLPGQEVKTGVEGDESVGPAQTADLGPQEYIVQAASFPRRADADMLRAQLMLDGMEVAIASSPQEGGGLRHRVLVGPFDNQADARETRSALREREIQATILARPLPRQPGGQRSPSSP